MSRQNTQEGQWGPTGQQQCLPSRNNVRTGPKLLKFALIPTLLMVIGLPLHATNSIGATVEGYAWNDSSKDGYWGEEDIRVGDTIYIDVNNNGVFDDGEPSTTTDSDGHYLLDTSLAGNYVIRHDPGMASTTTEQTYPYTYTWLDSEGNGDGSFTAPDAGQWYDISVIGGELRDGQQSDFYAIMPLPFTFPFYGITRYSIIVTEKGYVSFDGFHHYFTYDSAPPTLPQNPGQAQYETLLEALPILYSTDFYTDNYADYTGRLGDEESATDVIAAFWNDMGSSLSDTGTGTIYYFYDSTENRFIIQWQNISYYGGGGDFTFQIQLYADGRIYLVYDTLSGYIPQLPLEGNPGPGNLSGGVGLEAIKKDFSNENNFFEVLDISNELEQDVAHSSYTVAFAPETGHPVTLGAETHSIDKNFGIHSSEPIILAGYCLLDDGDGVVTESDSGLEGVTVYLDLNNNTTLDDGEPTAMTDSNGYYEFSLDSTGDYLLPGSYSVRQLTPPEYAVVPRGTATDYFGTGSTAEVGPVYTLQFDLMSGAVLHVSPVQIEDTESTLSYLFLGDMASNSATGETLTTGIIHFDEFSGFGMLRTTNCWMNPDNGSLLPIKLNNLEQLTDAMFFWDGSYYYFETGLFIFGSESHEYPMNKLMQYNPLTGVTSYRGSISGEITPLSADVDETNGIIYVLATVGSDPLSNTTSYALFTLDIGEAWPQFNSVQYIDTPLEILIAGVMWNPTDEQLYVAAWYSDDDFNGTKISRLDGIGGSDPIILTDISSIEGIYLVDIESVNNNQTAYTITSGEGGSVYTLNFLNQQNSVRVYVDASNTAGGATGKSWATAFPSLQDGLAAVQAELIAQPDVSAIEVWVADGTYSPGGSTTNTFTLLNKVSIYGGFQGNETALNQRNWVEYPSILNGANTNYHVVTGTGVDGTATLDGFVISGGYASTSTGTNSYGAGMILTNASPTLTNLLVSNNIAKYQGGGIYAVNSSSVLTNVTFSGNDGRYYGGGAYFSGGAPSFEQCSFLSNTTSTYGGGLFVNQATVNLKNSVFIDNSCTLYGGGAYFQRCTGFVLNNNTFLSNSSSTRGQGGGIATDRASSGQIHNSIFWNNVGQRNKQLYNVNLSLVTVANCVIQLGYSPSTGTITADPKLNADGTLSDLTPASVNTGVGVEAVDRNNSNRTQNEIGAFAHAITR